MELSSNKNDSNDASQWTGSALKLLQAYQVHQSDSHYLSRKDSDENNKGIRQRSVKDFLEENHRYLGYAYQGLAIVQTALQKVNEIEERVHLLKERTCQTLSGQYDQEEVLAFQNQCSEWLCEITHLAVNFRPGGFAMLSSTGFGMVGIEIERGQKIEVDSMDLTASGLGLLQAADLTRCPQDTLTNIELALEEIAAYKQHLKDSELLLEKTLDTLNDEREALLPVWQSISRKDTARRILQQIIRALADQAPFLAAIQTGIEPAHAAFLLSNQKTEDQ